MLVQCPRKKQGVLVSRKQEVLCSTRKWEVISPCNLFSRYSPLPSLVEREQRLFLSAVPRALLSAPSSTYQRRESKTPKTPGRPGRRAGGMRRRALHVHRLSGLPTHWQKRLTEKEGRSTVCIHMVFSHFLSTLSPLLVPVPADCPVPLPVPSFQFLLFAARSWIHPLLLPLLLPRLPRRLLPTRLPKGLTVRCELPLLMLVVGLLAPRGMGFALPCLPLPLRAFFPGFGLLRHLPCPWVVRLLRQLGFLVVGPLVYLCQLLPHLRHWLALATAAVLVLQVSPFCQGGFLFWP